MLTKLIAQLIEINKLMNRNIVAELTYWRSVETTFKLTDATVEKLERSSKLRDNGMTNNDYISQLIVNLS